MRSIRKSFEPKKLTQWREAWGINANYNQLRKDKETLAIVLKYLIEDQGDLCAYTGLRISEDKCHIEHVKPQTRCEHGEDVSYNNLLACYPLPNQETAIPFGAFKKGDWPSQPEAYLFVSPLSNKCEERFSFNFRGEISHRTGDIAAETTIKKLRLDHSILNDYRRAAIQGVLGKNNEMRLAEARKRLVQLENRKNGHLDEFCFVLIQALDKHIRRLEAIAKSKKERK